MAGHWSSERYEHINIDNDALLEQGEYSPEAIEALLNEVQTVAEVAQGLGMSRISLAQACQNGRLQARKSGATWLTTIAAVKAAIKAGTLRPRNK